MRALRPLHKAHKALSIEFTANGFNSKTKTTS
jgi:hypothetical protein